ncbi:hypothetical protein [Gordonia tangerina]|uniref:Uncharacterized protein n=1 Tax=Gordonia tangerina TaxID=2911060 RepID=A0ABS9DSJ7_9ACTN|nr:hypothetical protein [Gordonia tangerina]MCF3940921.1 hypothetical protein [Gordonia tangerina]
MPKYYITPAHGEEVQCHFTIPRKGKTKPITFTVTRMDYINGLDTALLDWSTERMTPTPVLGDNGEPVLDEHGQPVTNTPPEITDREAILNHLRLAGIPAATLKALDTLTNGELIQIHRDWSHESTKPVPVRYYDPDTNTLYDADKKEITNA